MKYILQNEIILLEVVNYVKLTILKFYFNNRYSFHSSKAPYGLKKGLRAGCVLHVILFKYVVLLVAGSLPARLPY